MDKGIFWYLGTTSKRKCQKEIRYTPTPHLMRIHLVQNSTSAIFGKSPKIHLARPIHLVQILPIIYLVQKFALSEY